MWEEIKEWLLTRGIGHFVKISGWALLMIVFFYDYFMGRTFRLGNWAVFGIIYALIALALGYMHSEFWKWRND